MTTITIKADVRLTQTEFRDEFELLKHLAKVTGDYNDPDFRNTIITDEITEKANQAKKLFKSNPDSFHRSI
jgi:hypothetical protein